MYVNSGIRSSYSINSSCGINSSSNGIYKGRSVLILMVIVMIMVSTVSSESTLAEIGQMGSTKQIFFYLKVFRKQMLDRKYLKTFLQLCVHLNCIYGYALVYPASESFMTIRDCLNCRYVILKFKFLYNSECPIKIGSKSIYKKE